MSIVIRKATKDDIPEILNMINELAEYEKLADQVVVNEQLLQENIFDKKYAEILIGEFDGIITGYAIFFHNFSTFLGKPGIYLEDIYVKPEFRKKGVGKALLKEIIKIAKQRNCGRVEWVVLDWNKPAMDFYYSLGAKDIREWVIFRLKEDKF